MLRHRARSQQPKTFQVAHRKAGPIEMCVDTALIEPGTVCVHLNCFYEVTKMHWEGSYCSITIKTTTRMG